LNGSDHQIARDPARVARRERHHQISKQIESMLDRGGCAAERKNERAAKIEDHQQRVYEAMSVHDHRVYADSQACAATTSASTPVSNVGWITGAKRGL